MTAATPQATLSAPSVDAAVGATVCGYGSTFKSLDESEHLTVVLRSGGLSKYYVFAQKDVGACAGAEIDAETLLSRAEIYTL